MDKYLPASTIESFFTKVADFDSEPIGDLVDLSAVAEIKMRKKPWGNHNGCSFVIALTYDHGATSTIGFELQAKATSRQILDCSTTLKTAWEAARAARRR